MSEHGWGGVGGRQDGGGVDERSGVEDGGGVDDGGHEGGAVHDGAALVADGGGHGSHDGGAVDGGGEQAWTGGGQSKESGQHHQFEHLELIGLCRAVDKLRLMTWVPGFLSFIDGWTWKGSDFEVLGYTGMRHKNCDLVRIVVEVEIGLPYRSPWHARRS